MTISIEVPDSVVRQAEAQGVPLAQFVEQALKSSIETLPPGFARLDQSARSPEEAGRSLRELAGRYTLGGLKIKDLIEEGRCL